MEYFETHGILCSETLKPVPHIICFEPANQEKLMKLTKLATLCDEVEEWLNDNVSGIWLFGDSMIKFENLEDAMAFKLRWS